MGPLPVAEKGSRASGRGHEICPPPVAESRAIAVCAAIGERGRCFVTDEDTEYRKRTASDAAAPLARRAPGTATGIVRRAEACVIIGQKPKKPHKHWSFR